MRRATNRKRELRPVQESVLARLERNGQYCPLANTAREMPSVPGGRHDTDAEVEALLDEEHGDHGDH